MYQNNTVLCPVLLPGILGSHFSDLGSPHKSMSDPRSIGALLEVVIQPFVMCESDNSVKTSRSSLIVLCCYLVIIEAVQVIYNMMLRQSAAIIRDNRTHGQNQGGMHSKVALPRNHAQKFP